MATKFADMPQGERRRWLAWCAAHDWGAAPGCRACHYDEAGRLVTYGGEFDAAGNYSIVEARHTTPAGLRAWAGY